MATEIVALQTEIRDRVGDHLLTPSQIAGVRSMDRDLLLKNVVSTAKLRSCLASRSCTRPST